MLFIGVIIYVVIGLIVFMLKINRKSFLENCAENLKKFQFLSTIVDNSNKSESIISPESLCS